MRPHREDRVFEDAANSICHWPKAKHGIDALRRLGVRSFKQLGEEVPMLGVRLRRTALWLMAHAETGVVQPILIELLKDRRVARDTAAVLSRGLYCAQTARTLEALGRMIRQADDRVVRLAAVEAVSPCTNDARIVDALIEVATKIGEDMDVRSATINQIVTVLQLASPRSQLYRRGIRALRQLQDERNPALHRVCETALFNYVRLCKWLPTRRELHECARVRQPLHATEYGVDLHFDAAAQRMIDEALLDRTATDAQEQLATLHEAGVTSIEKLRSELAGMRNELRNTSIDLLSHTDRRIATPIFLQLLRDPDFTEGSQLWWFLSDSGSRRVCNEVVNAMLEDDSATIRNSAIHSLPHRFSDELIRPLLNVATNPQETPINRGDAIGQIGVVAEKRRTRDFKLAAKTITGLLRNEAVEVRFWCCNALGNMRIKSAVPELRRVARSDNGYYMGLRTSMKEEAGSAIVAIITGRWPSGEEQLFDAVRT